MIHWLNHYLSKLISDMIPKSPSWILTKLIHRQFNCDKLVGGFTKINCVRMDNGPGPPERRIGRGHMADDAAGGSGYYWFSARHNRTSFGYFTCRVNRRSLFEEGGGATTPFTSRTRDGPINQLQFPCTDRVTCPRIPIPIRVPFVVDRASHELIKLWLPLIINAKEPPPPPNCFAS